jgi:hypothetical protein
MHVTRKTWLSLPVQPRGKVDESLDLCALVVVRGKDVDLGIVTSNSSSKYSSVSLLLTTATITTRGRNRADVCSKI